MVKTYAKKITAFMSVVAMLFSMLLYFPGGTFSNISFGLKASAAESINGFTLSAVAGTPKGNSGEEYTNLFDDDTETK